MSRAELHSMWEMLDRREEFLETIADARLDRSRIHGYGLFSTRDRLAGEQVVILDGQSVSLDVLPEVLFTLEWNALSEQILLVRPLRTSYGFINHTFKPNLVIAADGITLLTTRPITVGDELTLDYTAQPLPRAYLEAPQGSYLRP